jgi:hypothetical protein
MKATPYINFYPISSSGVASETTIDSNGIIVSESNGGVNPSNILMGSFVAEQITSNEEIEYLIVDLNQDGPDIELIGANLDVDSFPLSSDTGNCYKNVSKYSAVIVEGSISISSQSPSNPQNFSSYYFTQKFITNHDISSTYGTYFGEDIEIEEIVANTDSNWISADQFIINYNNLTKIVTFTYNTGNIGTQRARFKGIYTLI